MGRPVHEAAELPSVELAPGYSIPRLIVGCWQFSERHSRQPIDEARALDALEAYVDAGFNTFDCADIYTGVESLLGRLIRRRARGAGGAAGSSAADAIRVHTKFVPDRDELSRCDRSYVRRIVHRSLRRLGMERLDLVQFAWWDYSVPGYLEAAAHLVEMQTEGKIRCLGVTNFDTERLRELLDGGIPVTAAQVQYSLLDRRPENGLAKLCVERGVHLLTYGTLAGGFLSDRWLDEPLPRAPFEHRSLEKYRLIIDDFGGWIALQELLEVLQAVAACRQVDLSDVALRATLDLRGVGAAIVGIRDASHLHAHLTALRLELEEEDRLAIAAILARRRGPAGEVFGLERVPDGAHARLMRYNLNRC